MTTKKILHYVTDTFESETPTAACGIKTNHAVSTENPMAVTCGRCKRVMIKMLGGQPEDIKRVGPTPVEETKVTNEEIAALELSPEEMAELEAAGVDVTVEEEPDEDVPFEVQIGSEPFDHSQTLEVAAAVAQQTSVSFPEDVINVIDAKENRTVASYRAGNLLPPPKGKATKGANIGEYKKAKEAKAVTKAPAPKPVKEAKPAKVAKVKVEKVMPFCECGCGDQTRGGRFRPGHDMKLVSRQKAEERAAAEAKKIKPVKAAAAKK